MVDGVHQVEIKDLHRSLEWAYDLEMKEPKDPRSHEKNVALRMPDCLRFLPISTGFALVRWFEIFPNKLVIFLKITEQRIYASLKRTFRS